VCNGGSGEVHILAINCSKITGKHSEKNKQKYLLIPTPIYIILAEHLHFQSQAPTIQYIFNVNFVMRLASFF